MRSVKILVWFAVWSESSLGAHVQRYIFWRCGSYTNQTIFRSISNSAYVVSVCFWHLNSKRLTKLTCLQSLRKHAYSYIQKISRPKIENFQFKNCYIFHISSQNIDCGYSLEPPRRGGFNEYPQSMFLSRNKKNNVYPCKHQFYYIKVRFKRIKTI